MIMTHYRKHIATIASVVVLLGAVLTWGILTAGTESAEGQIPFSVTSIAQTIEPEIDRTTTSTSTSVPPTTVAPAPPEPVVLPSAPSCATWGSQAEADAWFAANAATHDVSNIDTDGDGRPCTLHFAPPPTVAPQSAPAPSQGNSAPSQATPGSGGCAVPDYICQRESRGDPNAYNPTGCSGRGCYGKYQFDPRTWDAAAQSAGRPDLVGNAAGASEADQDAIAGHLWNGGAGCSHWAACG
jgi:hypothetical protein